jgi:AbrB family looped-hinge helix DNA binding protein
MSTLTNLDYLGRLVLPKTIRNYLWLSPGDTIEVQVNGDEIIIKKHNPRHPKNPPSYEEIINGKFQEEEKDDLIQL